ncbi:MAG: hypothetical protein KF830_17055 [Planctomycetes bacterium]|nr:hypothetical protein [Planctomycetota bacterium]
MMSSLRVRLPLLLVAGLGLSAPGRAQLDLGGLGRARAEAEAAVAAALAEATAGTAAVRAALADANHKLQGSCDEIHNALRGGAFEPALGVVPIALEHLPDYVAEERQEAVRRALLALREQLAAGHLWLQRCESLQELEARGRQLAALDRGDDATGLLQDLAASARRAGRTQALSREAMARLQQHLAREHERARARTAAELRPQVQAELAQLQTDFASMRAEMASGDAGERDRGFARFDEAARSLRTMLARLGVEDRDGARPRLEPMQAEADALYAQACGAATAQRLQENWAFTADEFAGWEDETAEISAWGYVNFEPSGVDQFLVPRTVALRQRANVWLAFAGADADVRRNRRVPEVAALLESIVALRQRAADKLLPLVRTVVAGLAEVAIEDERVRGRLQTLADWDLPLALQHHPELAALRADVHARLDAHDRATLGEAAAARIAAEAAAAAEALWPRAQQWLPVEGGFEAATAELFVGRLVRLEDVWLRTDEFDLGGADLAFDLGGYVFLGELAPAVRDQLAAAQRRLGLAGGDLLSRDAPCELLAVVEGEAQVRLLGPAGASDAIAVPARRLRVLGVRQEARCAIAPE